MHLPPSRRTTGGTDRGRRCPCRIHCSCSLAPHHPCCWLLLAPTPNPLQSDAAAATPTRRALDRRPIPSTCLVGWWSRAVSEHFGAGLDRGAYAVALMLVIANLEWVKAPPLPPWGCMRPQEPLAPGKPQQKAAEALQSKRVWVDFGAWGVYRSAHKNMPRRPRPSCGSSSSSRRRRNARERERAERIEPPTFGGPRSGMPAALHGRLPLCVDRILVHTSISNLFLKSHRIHRVSGGRCRGHNANRVSPNRRTQAWPMSARSGSAGRWGASSTSCGARTGWAAG